MDERPTRRVAVILQREPVQSRWETHRWELVGVVPDVGGAPRTLREEGQVLQRLFPGFELTLYRDEAEGYFLNASSEAPSVFVCIRDDESGGDPFPFQATLSYGEAARWMDSAERVERALAWPELAQWLGDWVGRNYRPEPRKRRRPKSFEGREGRFREEGES